MLLGCAGAAGLGFVGFAPNRILSGRPIPLWEALGPATLTVCAGMGLMLAACVAMPRKRWADWLALAVALAACIGLPIAAGQAASALVDGSPARVALGGGFWVLYFAAALLAVDAAQRLRLPLSLRSALAVAPALALLAAGTVGAFDDLSLAREYANRREAFLDELGRHVVLVAAAVGLATLIGVPLGLVARARPRWGGGLFAVLSLLQTLPSIALFGLLIGPLSWLAASLPALQAMDVRGIGIAPALIALVLYSLLPVARNTRSGLAAVPAGAVEAARGMGMRPAQILWRVEVPLAWPVLLAGLRLVTVQAIGLAVVAALIGAGGLGTFVFQGLGQNAVDLVLLGALATIVVALAADLGFQLLIAAAGRAA